MMRDWNYTDTLVVLWVLLTFLWSTNWDEPTTIEAPEFIVDNDLAPNLEDGRVGTASP